MPRIGTVASEIPQEVHSGSGYDTPLLAAAMISTAAPANASAYDAVTASTMNNLANSMAYYGLMNGSYTGVTESALQPYGFNNSSSTHISLYVENGGQDFAAIGQDIHSGSALYVYSTAPGMMDAGVGSVHKSTYLPSVPATVAEMVIDDLSGVFDWATLALEFSTASATDVCDQTLFAPNQTHLNGTTLPDSYVACTAAASVAGATGATVIQGMKLSGYATQGVLAFLALYDATATPTAVLPDWSGHDPAQGAPTLPENPQEWPNYWNIRKLSAKVATVNSLPSPISDIVTQECEYDAARAALPEGPDDACTGYPIFVTGQSDVPEATNHDSEALQDTPQWVKLNWRLGSENPSYSGWYRSDDRCATIPAGTNCDEFPFFATEQGGGQADLLPSLKLINLEQNQAQGNLYQGFLNTCHVNQGATSEEHAFLIIPLPESASIYPSMAICNGH
jgi:hypothetical protein